MSAGEGRLLNAEEVARLIGMTPDYVYALSRRGRIPTITFGRTRRYRRESIEVWLEELEAGRIEPDRINGGGRQSGPPRTRRVANG